MELVKIALYGIGSAAIASLFASVAIKGVRAFQMRYQTFELRQPDPPSWTH
jgi:hypothetical protein